jgi:hypothetical protein
LDFDGNNFVRSQQAAVVWEANVFAQLGNLVEELVLGEIAP